MLARAFNAMAARLRQLDEMKEEFFAIFLHELRSPLTSVREAAHLLADGVPGPLTTKQARLVEIIGRSSDRLLRLVNQILDVSRLRAGLLPIEQLPVDLERVVVRAAEELRPQAEEAGITLRRERVGTKFVVTGDEERLVQVVVNLVANAVRFTPTGGQVVLRTVDAAPSASCRWRTPASASRPPSCPTCSRRTGRRTSAAAAPVSAWRSCGRWCWRTAGA